MRRYALLFSSLFTVVLYGQCIKPIALDIGHTPKRQGAYSCKGIGEYQYNKRAALNLFFALKRKKIEAFFINPEEKEISLKQRVQKAKEENAGLLVSIHHDSVKEKYLKHDRSYPYSYHAKGYGLFVSPKNPYVRQSLDLAKHIGVDLTSHGFSPTLHHTEDIKGERKQMYDRAGGVYRYDNLVVLKYASMPAILIEHGVIVNPEDESRVSNKDEREAFAEILAEDISQWCNQQ